MTVYGDPYTFLTNYSLSIYKRIRFKWISKIIYRIIKSGNNHLSCLVYETGFSIGSHSSQTFAKRPSSIINGRDNHAVCLINVATFTIDYHRG